MKEAGYSNVITAEDGKQAIEQTKAEKPDLLIIDTLLGKDNGFEVCRKIRDIGEPTSPKIIIITGAIDAVDAVKARKMGADDYCAKTSDCALLIEAVKNLI